MLNVLICKMLLLLRQALIKQFESAHYIKIGDGRLCMQWAHAIVGAEPTGQLTHNSSYYNYHYRYHYIVYVTNNVVFDM